MMIPKIEKRKYERKGLVSTIAGFSILFSIIFLVREIAIKIWPDHIEDKEWFFFKGAILIHYCA